MGILCCYFWSQIKEKSANSQIRDPLTPHTHTRAHTHSPSINHKSVFKRPSKQDKTEVYNSTYLAANCICDMIRVISCSVGLSGSLQMLSRQQAGGVCRAVLACPLGAAPAGRWGCSISAKRCQEVSIPLTCLEIKHAPPLVNDASSAVEIPRSCYCFHACISVLWRQAPALCFVSGRKVRSTSTRCDFPRNQLVAGPAWRESSLGREATSLIAERRQPGVERVEAVGARGG